MSLVEILINWPKNFITGTDLKVSLDKSYDSFHSIIKRACGDGLLGKFMKSKLPISKDKLNFREIWIGGLSAMSLRQKLKDNNISINAYGLQIINHRAFTTSPTREKLQTVEISVSDLGFSNGATTQEVYQQAQEFGLKLCPPELAIHMRLQYIDLNQPIDPVTGNWQNISMKELSDDPDFPKGFYLRRREDGFWIRGYRSSPEHLWSPNDRFVFVSD